MKKFAMFALVAALVIALAAPALAETKIGGSYRVRGIYWDQGLDKGKFNNDIPGTGRYFDNRLRLNIDSKVTDTLAVHVVADSGLGYNGRNGDFQNPAATPDSYDGIWNAGGSIYNLPEPAAADRDTFTSPGHDIVFQEAYMDFTTPIGAFSLGRQWAFWGMGLMVGENRNRLAWSYQAPGFQVGAGYDKFLESQGETGVMGNAGAFNKGDDIDNYFLWALMSGPNWQLGPYFEYTHADTFTLNQIVPTLSTAEFEGVNLYGVSLYGSANFGPLALAAEFAYRGGSMNFLGADTGPDVNAWAVVGRGTYELSMMTVGAEIGYLSGQDPAETDEVQAFLTPFSFSPFAILGEFAINGTDLNGLPSRLPGSMSADDPGSYSDFLSNIVYGKAFLQASPIPKLDAYLSVGYGQSAQANILDKSELGYEIDLSLTYAITPNLSYNFTAGYLFLGDFYNNQQNLFGSDTLGTNNPEDAMLAVHSITVNW
jgi:hypothetical protein